MRPGVVVIVFAIASSFLCGCALAQPASLTPCPGTPIQVPLTSSGSFKAINVVAPVGSIVVCIETAVVIAVFLNFSYFFFFCKVQGVPGASWSASFYADSTRQSQVTFTAGAVVNGVLTLTVSDTNPVPTRSSSVQPMWILIIACLALLAFVSSSSSMSSIQIFVATSLLCCPLVALALPQALYYCSRGTLVVTYPQNAQIFVSGLRLPTCSSSGNATGSVQTPTPYTAQPTSLGETAWFASPIIVDLDMQFGAPEIVVCAYSCFVYNASQGQVKLVQKLDSAGNNARAYAPHCVVDLDKNNKMDLCVAKGRQVLCYEWNSATRQFSMRPGFPKTVATASGSAEIRGMACADINFDNKIEIAVSTTDSRVQTFVIDSSGSDRAGWPRYNTDSSALGDADPDNGNLNGRNNMGHYRYGSYGLNVGIGNLDDDAYLEVVTGFDNHQIQAFKINGLAINVGPFYKNVLNKNGAKGKNITLGQKTPTWTFKAIDDYQWNALANGTCYANPLPTGNPCTTGGDEWMQFTESPISVNDIDVDGKAEIS